MKNKELKTRIILGIIFVLAFTFIGLLPDKVFAATSATMGFNGSGSAELGKNVTYEVQISNITGDQVTAVGGQIDWDTDYLQYVSHERVYSGPTMPYGISYIESTRRFAGLSTDGIGLTGSKTLLKITSMKLSNTSVSDSKSTD